MSSAHHKKLFRSITTKIDGPIPHLAGVFADLDKELFRNSDFELQHAAEEERLQQLKVIEHIKEKVGEQIIEEATREVMGEDGDDEDVA